MFIKKPLPNFTENLLHRNCKVVKTVVGPVIGLYRCCLEKEKTVLHVLCECKTLAWLHHVSCESEKSEAISCKKEPAPRMCSLSKKMKLDTEL